MSDFDESGAEKQGTSGKTQFIQKLILNHKKKHTIKITTPQMLSFKKPQRQDHTIYFQLCDFFFTRQMLSFIFILIYFYHLIFYSFILFFDTTNALIYFYLFLFIYTIFISYLFCSYDNNYNIIFIIIMLLF